LVLHAAEPGLDQRGELGDVAFGEVGQRAASETRVLCPPVTPELPPDQVRDPGQRPALVLVPAPNRRAGVESRLQLGQLNRG
jgi:hypothetical protein